MILKVFRSKRCKKCKEIGPWVLKNRERYDRIYYFDIEEAEGMG